jgi:suppressor of ftsI
VSEHPLRLTRAGQQERGYVIIWGAAEISPCTRVSLGTAELHPLHIHHVHFLAYAENGVPLPHPAWLDTVNVPCHGSVDVILNFIDPVIKGMSVFHCHLLNHEDKGMMAKILLQ